MNMEPFPETELLISCPGPRAWVEAISKLLVSGTCVAVHLPGWMDRSVVRSAVLEQAFRYRTVEDVDLALEVGDRGPVPILDSRTGTGAQLCRAVEEGRPQHVPNPAFEVLLLDGLGELSVDEAEAWLKLLRAWPAAVAAADDSQRWPTFAVFTDGVSTAWELPAADVRMQNIVWGDCCSILELRLALRAALGLSPGSPRSAFLEHVLISLCGGDLRSALEVAVTVADSGSENISANVGAHLMSLAVRLGLNTVDARLLGTPPRNPVSHDLGEDLRARSLLSRCCTSLTPEHGLEPGPLALGLAEGSEWEITHRIWRGEVALIFPLLDMIRLRYNRLFANRFGAVWPDRWTGLVDTEPRRSGPYAAEFSLIVQCLQNATEFSDFRHTLDLARHSLRTRNRLAHHEVVSFADFTRLMDLYKASGL